MGKIFFPKIVSGTASCFPLLKLKLLGKKETSEIRLEGQTSVLGNLAEEARKFGRELFNV